MREIIKQLNSENNQYTVLKTITTILSAYFFCIFSRFPQLVSFLPESSVNQSETDYLVFPSILNNLSQYENSLMVGNVEVVSSTFNLIMELSIFATKLGIDPNMQQLIAFLVQTLVGIIGVYLILSAFKLSYREIIIVLFFFLSSYFSPFGRYMGGAGFYKVVTSCFALSIGYLTLGFFVRGNTLVSVVLSACLAYIHPTHSLIVMLMIFTFVLYKSLLRGELSYAYLAKLILIFFLLLVPLFFKIIGRMTAFTGTGVTSMWWTLLKAKTSNPFPLQDGVVIVLPSLIIFFLVFFLLDFLYRQYSYDSFGRAKWILGIVLLLWFVQILFTEIWQVSFVARLSLTRVTPYARLFMIIIYVHLLWTHIDKDSKGIGLVLLLLPALLSGTQLFPVSFFKEAVMAFPFIAKTLGGPGEDFTIYPETLLLLIGLLIYIGYMKTFKLPLGTQKLINQFYKPFFYMISICLILVFCVKIYILYGKWPYRGEEPVVQIFKAGWLSIIGLRVYWKQTLLLVVVIMIWGSRIVSSKFPINIYSLKIAKSQIAFFFIILISIIYPIANSIATLKNPLKGYHSIEQVWTYLDEKTEKGEMVLVVPFNDTNNIPIMPKRPVFIDGTEVQFVLYNYEAVDEVMIRLSLLGVDMEKALYPDRCNDFDQYLRPMCRRIMFHYYSDQYNDEWRKNIDQMKKIAPNLSYVLMKKEYMHESDKLILDTGDLVIMRIDEVFREK